jgi:hypothetical protein
MPQDNPQNPNAESNLDATPVPEVVSSDTPIENAVDPSVELSAQFPPERRAVALGVIGWLIPGLGHALQKMWGRALIVFSTVGILVWAGASMRGNVFTSRGSDAFDLLGYIADLGTGVFYFAARAIERTGSDVSHASGDYGTRFLATAGVLNLLAALHAYEAARGRKA